MKRATDLLKVTVVVGFNTANLSFHLAGSVKMYSLLMFYQYEKKFGKPYLKIEKLLRSRGDKSA